MRAEKHHSSAPAATLWWSVGELRHQRMSGQERPDYGPLHPLAPPVNQPDFREAAPACLPQILVHYRGDLLRRKRVEIERVFEGKDSGFAGRVGARLVQGGERGPQKAGPTFRCFCQCCKLRRSSPESLHCQKVAARSKKAISTTPTPSARAASATF